MPYLRQCGPPALVDTLPPMDETIWLEGSGAKNHPRSCTARVSQRLISPGWTVAARFARSISTIRVIRFSPIITPPRSEEHTSELQSRLHLVCRLLLEKKKKSHKCYQTY